jgi:hypothetical protein
VCIGDCLPQNEREETDCNTVERRSGAELHSVPCVPNWCDTERHCAYLQSNDLFLTLMIPCSIHIIQQHFPVHLTLCNSNIVMQVTLSYDVLACGFFCLPFFRPAWGCRSYAFGLGFRFRFWTLFDFACRAHGSSPLG